MRNISSDKDYTSICHKGALQNEIVSLLNLKNGDIVVDATIGLASHARLILDKILPLGKLIGIDLDPVCINISQHYLSSYLSKSRFSDNVIIINGNFRDIDAILKDLGIKFVDKIFADLGVSSYHLDSGERGFSFRTDSYLDMRFNSGSSNLTAAYVVNNFTKERLAEIFRTLGGEKKANRIASLIVRERSRERIETTGVLANIVKRAYRHRRRIHPATKVFQALRIFVNDELNNLKLFLEKAPMFLKVKGRMAIISYHSLEDKLVKTQFKQLEETKNFSIITNKPIVPTKEEIALNHRVRSAKLRCIERTKAD